MMTKVKKESPETVRISISLEDELLKKFDQRIFKRKYSTRSEAIRDLIRADLVDDEWAANRNVVGTITILYDHLVRELPQVLTKQQHESHSKVISSMHVHLDERTCLEVIVVKGRSKWVQELADSLTAEAHPEPNIFDLLIDGLKQVQIQDNLETLCRFFEMRIISLAGYKPRLNQCIQCKKVPESRQVGYSFSRQGIVCAACMEEVGFEARINNGTLGYLKKLMSLDIQRTDRIKIPKGTEAEVESITHRLILARLGRELKSYPFIKKMAV